MAATRLPLPEPTTARPGSPEKVAVLEARCAAGQQLWHPDDGRPGAQARARESAEAGGGPGSPPLLGDVQVPRGVTWMKKLNLWGVRKTRRGDRRHVGYFKNLEEAVEALARAA